MVSGAGVAGRIRKKEMGEGKKTEEEGEEG